MKPGATIITPQGFTETVSKIEPLTNGKAIYTHQSKGSWYHIDKVILISNP